MKKTAESLQNSSGRGKTEREVSYRGYIFCLLFKLKVARYSFSGSIPPKFERKAPALRAKKMALSLTLTS